MATRKNPYATTYQAARASGDYRYYTDVELPWDSDGPRPGLPDAIECFENRLAQMAGSTPWERALAGTEPMSPHNRAFADFAGSEVDVHTHFFRSTRGNPALKSRVVERALLDQLYHWMRDGEGTLYDYCNSYEDYLLVALALISQTVAFDSLSSSDASHAAYPLHRALSKEVFEANKRANEFRTASELELASRPRQID